MSLGALFPTPMTRLVPHELWTSSRTISIEQITFVLTCLASTTKKFSSTCDCPSSTSPLQELHVHPDVARDSSLLKLLTTWTSRTIHAISYYANLLDLFWRKCVFFDTQANNDYRGHRVAYPITTSERSSGRTRLEVEPKNCMAISHF